MNRADIPPIDFSKSTPVRSLTRGSNGSNGSNFYVPTFSRTARTEYNAKSSTQRISSARTSFSTIRSPRQASRAKTSRAPQSACIQLHNIYNAYNELVEMYESFIDRLPQDLIYPELPLQYNRYVGAFEAFIKIASTTLGSVNPSKITTNYRKTSSLYQAGKTLMLEWVEFIEIANKIADEELVPHSDLVNACIEQIKDDIESTHNGIKNHRYKTDESLKIYKKILPSIGEIRKATSSIFLKPKSRRFQDFDIAEFDQWIKQFANLVCYYYDRSLPQYFQKQAENVRRRVSIVSQCGSIVSLMESAQRFEEGITRLKMKIVAFNNELNNIQYILNLPFVVELTLQKPPTSIEDVDFD